MIIIPINLCTYLVEVIEFIGNYFPYTRKLNIKCSWKRNLQWFSILKIEKVLNLFLNIIVILDYFEQQTNLSTFYLIVFIGKYKATSCLW